MKKKSNTTSTFNALKKKHKLSFSDESTYHEKWGFKVSWLNMISLIVLYSIIIISLIILAFKFTSLKSIFIEDVNLYELNENLNSNNHKIDSLQLALKNNNNFINNIKSILKNEDELDTTNLNRTSLPTDYTPSFTKSAEDSTLRLLIENSNHQEISNQNLIQNIDFYLPPIEGEISKSFNRKTKHYGVDIVGQKDEPIKATLDGVVVFSNWTSTQGYVIIIQHNSDLISVYKHNSSLLKTDGEKVKSGDPIAIIGNSGEYTDGVHLHFELWLNGNPINPQEFISFK